MIQNKITKVGSTQSVERSVFNRVKKRDGTIVEFEDNKIRNAVFKAITATGQGDGEETKKVSNKVVQILNRRFKGDEIPNVEQIQDIIEEVLILENLVETAKAYILYREQRRRIREAVAVSEKAVERVDQYLGKLDWEVKENANMAFSLQGLNQYGFSDIVKKYWLNKIYPKEIRQANESGDFHLHDLNTLAVYCSGWDLYDLLLKGFGGVPGKMSSKPPKHFRSALGQAVNFLYTITGEVAGAVSFSNFDTLMSPFIRYDNLNYIQTKQALQEFLFNMATPTRVGFQSPFSNITLDLKPSSAFAKQPVLIGGKLQKETYNEFEEEMKMFNKAFYEAMLEGDKDNRPFSFPIPTINITKDFPWDEPAFDGLFEASAKYGINYFSNYINSDMSPEDVRSMCLFPNETVFVREQGTIKKISIRELFNSFVREKIDKEWYSIKDNIETLSLNPETGKTEWAKIVRLLERYNNEIVSVQTKDGKMMRVSKDHLIAVFTKQGIKTKKAKDIDKEDFLLMVKDASGIFNKKTKTNNDLAWLIGFFIADGNYLYDSRYKDEKRLRGLQFSFHSQEKELIEKTRAIVKKLFDYDIKFIQDKRYQNSLRGYIYNKKSAEFLAKEKNVSKYNKLPNWIWSDSVETIESLLKGFFDGDGYEAGKEIHINDKNFAEELCLLMQIIGINTTYRVRDNSQVIRIQHSLGRNSKKSKIIKDELYNLVPEFLLDKKYIKMDENNIYQSYGSQTVGLSTIDRWGLSNDKIEWLRNADFAVVKVEDVNIEKVDYQQVFYDIELEKNHYFVHSEGNITHNCCRLRLDMTELRNRGGGGLFGSGSNTGSIGVVTINMPRIGYLSKTKKEFFEKLGQLMDLAQESLEIKRKTIENFIEKGLYPYSKVYLQGVKKMRNAYYANHFSTIGLVGMNEALLNFIGDNIASKRGRRFSIEILDFMREKLVEYQKETSNIYNLEATPAESTAYRLAQKDKEKYPDIITAGTKKVPYYTNSTQLPVNYTDDMFEALKLQDELTCKYTGGSVLHLFLGERISDIQTVKNLIKKIFEKFHLPYITITPTFSICPNHGYLSGEHFECPKCTIKQPCEVYTRVVGYLRPVAQFNVGKQQEFKERKEFKL